MIEAIEHLLHIPEFRRAAAAYLARQLGAQGAVDHEKREAAEKTNTTHILEMGATRERPRTSEAQHNTTTTDTVRTQLQRTYVVGKDRLKTDDDQLVLPGTEPATEEEALFEAVLARAREHRIFARPRQMAKPLEALRRVLADPMLGPEFERHWRAVLDYVGKDKGIRKHIRKCGRNHVDLWWILEPENFAAQLDRMEAAEAKREQGRRRQLREGGEMASVGIPREGSRIDAETRGEMEEHDEETRRRNLQLLEEMKRRLAG